MSAPDYITLAELKATMHLSGTTQDADLQSAITAASRAIDQMCDRFFYPVDPTNDQTRAFWPDNPGFVIIDDLYAFTSLSAQNSTWALDQDFMLQPLNAAQDGEPWTSLKTIARPFIFTRSEVAPGWAGFDGRIYVTGKFGWPATPPGIIQATTLLARKMFERNTKSPFAVVGLAPDGAVIRTGSYDKEFMDLVGPFQREPWFGW